MQGGDWNAQLKLGNSEFVGLNYLQSVTPRLALGGEAFWLGQQRKSGAGFAARHADDKHVATAQVATTGLVSLTYLRRISEKVRGPGAQGCRSRATVSHPCMQARRLARSWQEGLPLYAETHLGRNMSFSSAFLLAGTRYRVCGSAERGTHQLSWIDRGSDTGTGIFSDVSQEQGSAGRLAQPLPVLAWLHAGVPGERVSVELELAGGQRGVWVRLRAAPVPPARPRRHRRQGDHPLHGGPCTACTACTVLPRIEG